MSDSAKVSDTAKAWLAVIVAGIAFVIYIVLGILAWVKADAAQAETWARFLVVFAGFESIAFAAVGWLFGKEVSRQTIEQSDKALAATNEALEDAKTAVKNREQTLEDVRGDGDVAKREAVALAQMVASLAQPGKLESIGGVDPQLAYDVLKKYGLRSHF